MSLEQKSKELKQLLSGYDTEWFLGNLTGLMGAVGSNRANDQLGNLSSPLRQLYFLGGLLMSTSEAGADDAHYSHEEWDKFVDLLNEIEGEYGKLFLPKEGEVIDDKWKHVRTVAMPSFLAYFNQGPLNYEEQSIEWIDGLYSKLDTLVNSETTLNTRDFLQFYENLDSLHQRNFQAIMSPMSPVKANWKNYTKVQMAFNLPPELGIVQTEKEEAFMYFMSDSGLPNRFFPEELVSEFLSIDKVNLILSMLSVERSETEFLYYTSTKPGNPLLDTPIVKLDRGLYQVFEVKQVLHAIENILESAITRTQEGKDKYVEKKGALLEEKITAIFDQFFEGKCTIHSSYYIDGCEQDILVLWNKYAFIIEAKGYTLREPFRDPDKAFKRIKDEFNNSIGYAYKQTKRVQDYFDAGEALKLTDHKGKLIVELDTKRYDERFL